MTKRKTTRKKSARTAGRKRPVPGWIILSSGVLFGLLIAVIIYANGWVPEPVKNNDKPAPDQSAQQPVEDVSTHVAKRANNYDFYTVLPEMEVVIPKEDIAQEAAKKNQNYQYILQVASFKNKADAEAMKAKIAFSGQIAYIQTINVNDTQWHRVRVGPFESGREADKQKRAIEKMGQRVLMLKETTAEVE
ncbi:MAG: hypothetical protein DWP95_08945 [Proteobacteria bacterium]|nr:MAG: hypothetical protein DWP95_08945 [Pseudomonadota bacterium]